MQTQANSPRGFRSDILFTGAAPWKEQVAVIDAWARPTKTLDQFGSSDFETVTTTPLNDTESAVSTFFRHIVCMTASMVAASDLRNKKDFHVLLNLIDRLVDNRLTEVYVKLKHPELSGPDWTSKAKSMESKVSRWINGKAAPADLDTRQKVVAAALSCLVKSVENKQALPFRTLDNYKHCRVEEGANVRGLGEFSKLLH